MRASRVWTGVSLLTIVGLAPYLAAPDILNCPTCELYSGDSLTAVGATKSYSFAVKGGHTYSVTLQPSAGNPNLYLRYGATPTTKSWDCRPNSSGTTVETCTARPTSSGTEYLVVSADSAPATYVLWACDSAICK